MMPTYGVSYTYRPVNLDSEDLERRALTCLRKLCALQEEYKTLGGDLERDPRWKQEVERAELYLEQIDEVQAKQIERIEEILTGAGLRPTARSEAGREMKFLRKAGETEYYSLYTQ